MFKFKRSFALGLLLTSFIAAEASVITFKITKPTAKTDVVIQLASNDEQKSVKINTKGEGRIEINGESQYANLVYKKSKRLIYLDPKLDLTISFDAENLDKKISFNGANAVINTYLNDGKLKTMSYDDFKMKENLYIKKVDSLYEENSKVLRNAQLPEEFTFLEGKRLYYQSNTYLMYYPFYYPYLSKDESYKASENLLKRTEASVEFDAKLLKIEEYRSYLKDMIMFKADKLESKNSGDRVADYIQYVEENITDPKIREFIMYGYTIESINNKGLDNTEKIIVAFNKHVNNPKYISDLKALSDKWVKIKKGTISPSFSYLDINGKKVSLADLKGSYVYIDVWATWCSPCRGEIPSLKKLEEQYGAKGIHFVSISCDQNKKSWESMVKKEGLKGIQLHTGGDRKFMDEYMINGIPRFILLDREGKIVDANTTRPSDPNTAKTFDTLLQK